MLSFISFWRAAAIVLNDLGSSVYYAGGIAEQAIGKNAPWFILGVMLFSFAVVPSTWKAAACSCAAACTSLCATRWDRLSRGFPFPRLLFDYVLTGPISSVSAGQYLGRLDQRDERASALSVSPFSRISSRCFSPSS